jgi:hypothetical protein
MKDEIARRQSNAMKVWWLFLQHPGRWLHWRRFERIGGACAWRTRISDARKMAKAIGGVIEHNGSITRSAYRYLPYEPIPASHEASGQRRLALSQ